MTLQEKMNRIYELTGSEPDRWKGIDGHLVTTKFARDNNLTICININRCRTTHYQPHYTESKLWEMLLKVIDFDGYEYELAVKFTGHVCYVVDSVTEGLGIHYDYLKSISFDTSKIQTSLHEALVDMVLWSIENGHIKKKGEAHEGIK